MKNVIVNFGYKTGSTISVELNGSSVVEVLEELRTAGWKMNEVVSVKT